MTVSESGVEGESGLEHGSVSAYSAKREVSYGALKHSGRTATLAEPAAARVRKDKAVEIF